MARQKYHTRSSHQGTDAEPHSKKGILTKKLQVRYGLNSPWLPLRDVAFFSNLVLRSRFNFGKLEFWKRYKTLGIIVAVVLFIFLYVSFKTPTSGKLVTPGLHQEVLNQMAIINLTNKARTLNGLSPLNENPLLNAIAEKKSSRHV